jgi:hypothetical protein
VRAPLLGQQQRSLSQGANAGTASGLHMIEEEDLVSAQASQDRGSASAGNTRGGSGGQQQGREQGSLWARAHDTGDAAGSGIMVLSMGTQSRV